TRSFAVAEARPIECDGAILPRSLVDNPTDQQILHRGTVAVEENDARTLPPLDVVQARPTGGHEPSSGGICELGLPCLTMDHCGGTCQCHARKRAGPSPVRP